MYSIIIIVFHALRQWSYNIIPDAKSVRIVANMLNYPLIGDYIYWNYFGDAGLRSLSSCDILIALIRDINFGIYIIGTQTRPALNVLY